VVKTEERRNRIRDVRRQLVQDGPPRSRPHERDFETVSLPERDCDLLRDQLVCAGIETVVEVGLAYGSSALAIGEALVTIDPQYPRHLIIDPFQQQIWSNVGWDLLRHAGIDSTATLMPVPSSVALPQLLADGLVADGAFVDGSHRFHEVFVDLYYLRKIVRPGGLIIVDDDWTHHRYAPPYATTRKTWAGRRFPTHSPPAPTGPSATTPMPNPYPAAVPSDSPTPSLNHPSKHSGPFDYKPPAAPHCGTGRRTKGRARLVGGRSMHQTPAQLAVKTTWYSG
jgi:predicted O-methyltransferase YrrM